MADLIEILKQHDIGDKSNTESDIQKIVAESLIEALEQEPVISSIQIRNILERLLVEGVFTKSRHFYSTNKLYACRFVTPSNNPYIQASTAINHTTLDEAVREYARRKHPEIGIEIDFKLPPNVRRGVGNRSMILYYRDQASLDIYIKEHLSEPAIFYRFRIDNPTQGAK